MGNSQVSHMHSTCISQYQRIQPAEFSQRNLLMNLEIWQNMCWKIVRNHLEASLKVGWSHEYTVPNITWLFCWKALSYPYSLVSGLSQDTECQKTLEHFPGLSWYSRMSWPLWRCVHFFDKVHLGCRSKYCTGCSKRPMHPTIFPLFGRWVSHIVTSKALETLQFFGEFTNIHLVLSFLQVAIYPLAIQQN